VAQSECGPYCPPGLTFDYKVSSARATSTKMLNEELKKIIIKSNILTFLYLLKIKQNAKISFYRTNNISTSLKKTKTNRPTK
jgi:hypothetical protein